MLCYHSETFLSHRGKQSAIHQAAAGGNKSKQLARLQQYNRSNNQPIKYFPHYYNSIITMRSNGAMTPIVVLEVLTQPVVILLSNIWLLCPALLFWYQNFSYD